MSRPIPSTIRDSLVVRGGGAIANGRLSGRAEDRVPPSRHVGVGEVRVTYAPAWQCDTCPEEGIGQAKLMDHSQATGHRSFTEQHPERHPERYGS